ncbi:MAG: hypothetical protein K8T10_10085 [Candidatus Eremiobacteraeota bacterium]|nr:hypothetical protein [Candidatus Eremiobacteraeota bacterium]
MKNCGNQKGSILLLSIMLIFILLTLAISMVANEFTARDSALRAYMSGVQEQAIQVTLQRFLDAFSKETAGSNVPPVPPKSAAIKNPTYDVPFKCSPSNRKDFYITGTWKKENSIFYSPTENPGRDFTSSSEIGYYDNVTAQGFESMKVSPGHNMLVVDTPLKARYIAMYSYHFPYGAFAPGGLVRLKDAYGCSNPLDDKEQKDGKFLSGIPVEIFAAKNIEVQDFPFGKAYSTDGDIKISGKKGAIPFTSVAGSRVVEANNFKKIFERQIDNAYEGIIKVTLSKDKVFFGKPVNNILDFAKGLYADFLTLEQTTSFPFAGMTCSDKSPREKTMGCYYKFRVHAPYTPDKSGVSPSSGVVESSAKTAYTVLDQVLRIFKKYVKGWEAIPTEGCISIAEVRLGIDIAKTAQRLASAIDGLPWTALLVAYLTAKLAKLVVDEGFLGTFSVAFLAMRGYSVAFLSHNTGSKKDEPITVDGDLQYSNNGWPFVGVFTLKNDLVVFEQLVMRTGTKYLLLGTELLALTAKKYRTAHFGTGNFTNNFKNINKSNFDFNGTMTVPRGRTIKFSGSLTVEGDLWVQDGGALYVGDSLTVKAPVNPDPNINEMMRPSGRVFLGNGSTIIVENDFQCAGSDALGSILVAAPIRKNYEISSGIISNKGNLIIPYGVMPGVSVYDLAKEGALIPGEAPALNTMIKNGPNISKISGPFHARKAFFASNSAYVLVFRHKKLGITLIPLNYPLLLPYKKEVGNVLNNVMNILTSAFTIHLNAYLGENFFTHSDWWIFGEGVVPILPRMDVDLTSKETNILADCALALTEVTAASKVVNPALITGMEVITAASVASKAVAGVYGVFVARQFQNSCDNTAAQTAQGIKMTADVAYSPFTLITNQTDKARSTFLGARKGCNLFYRAAYAIMKIHLPGGLQQKSFVSCPGVFLYAGQNINLGIKSQANILGKTLPASGLFIAEQDINFYGNFRMVGCLASLNGNIYAEYTRLRFFPYFTRASLYTPKDVSGSLSGNFKLVSDSDLKSNENPQNIGITMPRIQAEGWEFYSEYVR